MKPELQLFLLLGIIIAVSKVAGHLSRRYLRQPVVFGEILVGLLLGPTLLNIFGWPVFSSSSGWLHENVNMLAHVGVLLLMFIAGLETNLEQMRSVGKVAFWAAALGVVLPLGAGAAISRFFGLNWSESVFIGTVLTATSVSISAQTLMEIGRLRSKEGMTILGAAVIDDIMGIIVLSFVVAFGMRHEVAESAASHEGIAAPIATVVANAIHLSGSVQAVQIAVTILLMGAFFGMAVFLGTRGLPRVMEAADRLHASHAIPAAALFLVFLFAVGAEYVGQVAAITGAYVAGIFLAQTRFKHEIEHGIHPFTYALFVPIFFMSIGLGADARQLAGGSILLALAMVIVAVLTKVVGCGLGARLTGFTTAEATRVGVGMVSRGEVGLIVAQVGIGASIIREPEYAAIVIMVLATTVLTPVLLRLSFPRQPQTEGEEDGIYESVVTMETEEEEEQYT